MGYPLDLDELSTRSLVNELKRRKKCAEQERCTYCGKSYATEACRMDRAHRGDDKDLLDRVSVKGEL